MNVTLSKREIELCDMGLGALNSDYNDAPHEEIETLRARLANSMPPVNCAEVELHGVWFVMSEWRRVHGRVFHQPAQACSSHAREADAIAELGRLATRIARDGGAPGEIVYWLQFNPDAIAKVH